MKAKELVDRYVYEVTRRLPEQQRADIDKELRGLIEDMLEERSVGDAVTVQVVEEVLLELGDPGKLSDQYRGYKRHLIGPELFPLYIKILNIVLFSVGIGMLVVSAIQTVIEPLTILEQFVQFIVQVMSALVQAFAWVTLSFAIVEYSNRAAVKKLGQPSEWKPSMLSPIPDSSVHIKKSDPIVSIIFTVLFAVIFVRSVELIGTFFNPIENGWKVVSFLDTEVFRSYLPFILGVLAIGLIKDLMKLIQGRWTYSIIAVQIVYNIAAIILAAFMFSDMQIWNPNFITELTEMGYFTANSEAYETVSLIWERAKQITAYAILIICLIDIGVAGYKAFRINKRTNILTA